MSEERMTVLTKEIDDWAAKKAEEDSTEVSVGVHRPWGAASRFETAVPQEGGMVRARVGYVQYLLGLS